MFMRSQPQVLGILLATIYSGAALAQTDDWVACRDANPNTVRGELTPLQEDFFTSWMARKRADEQNTQCWKRKFKVRQEKAVEEFRKRQQRIQAARPSFERTLEQLRSSLRAGGPTFEFNATNSAWGYQNGGCLIGGSSIYAYSVGGEPPVRVIGTADARDIASASQLAKGVMGQEFEAKPVAYDVGVRRWSATVDGQETTLKVMGIAEGELADDRARRLAAMIDVWCPVAAAVSRQWVAERQIPIVRLGTAQEARFMLQRGAAALKADRAAAMELFAQVIWQDLYVFCATADGELLMHPSLSISGVNSIVFKNEWAAKFREKILLHATKDEITHFSYMDVPMVGPRSQQVSKGAYIVKLSDLVCGVGYYH